MHCLFVNMCVYQLGLEAKERGNAAFITSNFSQAIVEFKKAVKLDPTNAIYYNNLAAAYHKMVKICGVSRSPL